MKTIAIILILLSFAVTAFGQSTVVVAKKKATACTTQTTPNDMETTNSTSTNVASAAGVKWIATKFIGDATSGTVCKICPDLSKVSSPTMTIAIKLFSNTCSTCDRTDDKPNAQLADYGSMSAASIAGSFGDCFTGTYAVANNTYYWVVIQASATSETNYVNWTEDATCATEDVSRSGDDGSSWSQTSSSKCLMMKLYR